MSKKLYSLLLGGAMTALCAYAAAEIAGPGNVGNDDYDTNLTWTPNAPEAPTVTVAGNTATIQVYAPTLGTSTTSQGVSAEDQAIPNTKRMDILLYDGNDALVATQEQVAPDAAVNFTVILDPGTYNYRVAAKMDGTSPVTYFTVTIPEESPAYPSAISLWKDSIWAGKWASANASEDNPGFFTFNVDFGTADAKFFISVGGNDRDNTWSPAANTTVAFDPDYTTSLTQTPLGQYGTAPDYYWIVPANSGELKVEVNLATLTMTISKVGSGEVTYPENLYVVKNDSEVVATLTPDASNPALFTGEAYFTGGAEQTRIWFNSINSATNMSKAFGAASDNAPTYIQQLENGTPVNAFVAAYTGYNYWDIRYWPGGTVKFTVNLDEKTAQFVGEADAKDIIYVIGSGATLGTDYENPLEVKFDNLTNTYRFTVENLEWLSISTAKGTQEAFEASALTLVSNPTMEDVTNDLPLDLVDGFALIYLPEVEKYDVTISLLSKTIRFHTNKVVVEYDYMPATGIKATVNDEDNTLNVTWNAPTAENLAPIANYAVLVNEAEEGTTTETSWSGPAPEKGTYQVKVRTVYADGTEIDSAAVSINVLVEGLAVDEADAVYFDVNGRRVANPEKGLYIRVINGKAQKTIIK